MKTLEKTLEQNITVDEMLNGVKENQEIDFIKKVHDMWYADIAKQIRKDLKDAYWKDFKFSVRIETYAGWWSIDVSIMEWNIEFYTEEYKKVLELNEYSEYEAFRESRGRTYTEEWEKVLEDVKTIWNRYNHNNSDSMTDYFDRNYYWDIKIWKWDKKYINKTI